MRRYPPITTTQSVFLPNITGSQTLLAPQSGCVYGLESLDIASDGSAGSGIIKSNGVDFDAVSFGVLDTVHKVLDTELAIGSGLEISLSAPVNVTLHYFCYDESGGPVKSDARATSYAAYIAARNAGTQAIRTPNIRGEQFQG